MKCLLVVYDNQSYIHIFPIGLAYIASTLRKDGHIVEIYNQDVHHYPDEHLTKHLDENGYDMVGVSTIGGYYQYHKLLKISEAINRSKNRGKFKYVIGGHGPSPEPEFFLKKTGADVIVIGEGEETARYLLNNFDNLDSVQGIAYPGKQTLRRPLIQDVDSIPMPAYDLFPIEHYRLVRESHTSNSDFWMPVLSGRGCHYQCNFCYRMDSGLRERSDDSIIEEIKYLQKDYRINYIAFYDELLMSSTNRILRLCEAMIKANLNIKWNCNGRLNLARPKTLNAMKRAGCVFINYGIECYDDEILKVMAKKLTVHQIEEGIKATLAEDISPGFNIIFGNIGENRETLQKGVDFLLKYDDGSQMRTIRPVTPYPGSPLYYHAINKGLLKDVEDFYENKHTNSDLMSINFTQLSDEEFYDALMNANRTLLHNYHNKKMKHLEETLESLYIRKDSSFRGFRQT